MKKILIPTKLNPIAKKTLESHGNYQVVQDDSKDIDELISEHSCDNREQLLRVEGK